MSDHTTETRDRPPLLHLGGGRLPCCGGWLLVLVGGEYRCPCGRRQEDRAGKILDGMDENRPVNRR